MLSFLHTLKEVFSLIGETYTLFVKSIYEVWNQFIEGIRGLIRLFWRLMLQIKHAIVKFHLLISALINFTSQLSFLFSILTLPFFLFFDPLGLNQSLTELGLKQAILDPIWWTAIAIASAIAIAFAYKLAEQWRSRSKIEGEPFAMLNYRNVFSDILAWILIIVCLLYGLIYRVSLVTSSSDIQALLNKALPNTQQTVTEKNKSTKTDMIENRSVVPVTTQKRTNIAEPIMRGISNNQWMATRSPDKKLEDWGGIVRSENETTLLQDRVDKGPNIISIGFPPKKGSRLKITRRVKLHSHISRSFAGGDEFFRGKLKVFSSVNSKKSSHSLMGLIELCSVTYSNFEYMVDQDMFYLQDVLNKSNHIPSIWDRAFSEIFIYDPKTGKASYQVGVNKVFAQCKIMNNDYLRIYIDTYGWWTGHYTSIYDFDARWIN
jgi:hypothetical protein